MNKQIDLALLRDSWMINPSAAVTLSKAAIDYLAGYSIADMFSKLSLPQVPENIALIPINGVMTKADICGGMGTRSLTDMVNAAGDDDKYSSVILFFEGVPGGQVDGTQAFANAIKNVKSKKPVVSAISNMCCSAGVWAASQSTEVFCTSATDMFGCIGVMAKISKGEGADAQYQVVYSNLSPDKNKEFEDAELLKTAYLDPVAEMFQNAVKEGRGDKLKADKQGVLSGATYLAAQAKQNGLIDGTMNFQKIIQRANFLSKKQKNNTMGNNTTSAEKYKAVCTLIGASALAPVEEGYAFTEAQLTELNTKIEAMNTAAVSNKTALDAANTSLEAEKKIVEDFAISIASKDTEISGLQAKVKQYAPKSAVIKDIQANHDKYEHDSKYLTSVDAEAAEMQKQWGTNKKTTAATK